MGNQQRETLQKHYMNPGSETVRQREEVPEQQPPNHPPLLGLQLLQHLLSAGTKAANLTGGDVWGAIQHMLGKKVSKNENRRQRRAK